MIRRLRVAIGTIWVATLVAVAVVASSMNGGGRVAAGPPRVVVQPADAGTVTPLLSTTISPPVTDTTTTAPPTTTAPVTVPPPAPTTAPPRTAPPTTAAPRPAPTAPARPAVVTPPPTTTPATIAAGSRGSAGDFTTIGYRWNPCQVITITSAGPDIAAIVNELASITGLHLQLVSGPAEITVIWGSVPTGGEIGLTAWKAVGRFLIESGVVISPQAQPYLATVLRHELAHAMGLGHATRGDEIMYPSVGSSSPTDYQAGDLAGLRSIGASAGC